MKKLGLIAAMTDELDALSEKTEALESLPSPFGKKLFRTEIGDKEIYLTESGVGEIYAAAATQHLITAYGVEAIINFGVCGSLTESLGLKKTVIVSNVVHYEMDTSALDGAEPGVYTGMTDPYIPLDRGLISKALEEDPALPTVICASGNKFIADKKDKEHLKNTFNADVCEMESAGIALVCRANGIPCLMVKAVSDGEGGADDFIATLHEAERVYISLVQKLINTL